jgi:hypothetical protein
MHSLDSALGTIQSSTKPSLALSTLHIDNCNLMHHLTWKLIIRYLFNIIHLSILFKAAKPVTEEYNSSDILGHCWLPIPLSIVQNCDTPILRMLKMPDNVFLYASANHCFQLLRASNLILPCQYFSSMLARRVTPASC